MIYVLVERVLIHCAIFKVHNQVDIYENVYNCGHNYSKDNYRL